MNNLKITPFTLLNQVNDCIQKISNNHSLQLYCETTKSLFDIHCFNIKNNINIIKNCIQNDEIYTLFLQKSHQEKEHLKWLLKQECQSQLKLANQDVDLFIKLSLKEQFSNENKILAAQITILLDLLKTLSLLNLKLYNDYLMTNSLNNEFDINIKLYDIDFNNENFVILCYANSKQQLLKFNYDELINSSNPNITIFDFYHSINNLLNLLLKS